MNKIKIIPLLALLGMAGCQKKIDDTIGGQTVDQRLTAALAAYQKQLTTAPDGWILIELTTGTALNQGSPTQGPAAAFAYFVQFNDSNKVTMFSDFDTTTALTPQTSSYRLKATQRPSLIFDSYSYIHLPCDPNPAISQSPFGPGLGWGADFEFSFADSTPAAALGDTIQLLGNLNGATAIMIKATQAQRDAYFNGTFAKDFIFGKIQNYFKNVVVGLKTYQFTPGLGNRIVDVSWLNGGTLHSTSTPFYQVADGIGFATPITGNGAALTGLQNIVWDPATSTASVKVNGVAATLAGAIAPLKYDPNSTADWYFSAADIGGLYFSLNGFHVDGVDDAFRLDTLTYNGLAYNAYVYFPGGVNGGGGNFFDLFSPFFASGSQAGYPSYFAVAFVNADSQGLGLFDIFPQDTTPDPITATNNLMDETSNPDHFYFILKEDGTTYDQVISSDAKSWITWTFQP
jgi:hypothetical protein